MLRSVTVLGPILFAACAGLPSTTSVHTPQFADLQPPPVPPVEEEEAFPEADLVPLTPYPVGPFCLYVRVEDQLGRGVPGAFIKIHPHSDLGRSDEALPEWTDEEGTQQACVPRVAHEPEGNDVHIEVVAGPPYASRQRGYRRRETGDSIKVVLCDWSLMGLDSPDKLPSHCL